MSGWIRLQRGTLTHSVFDRTPFSEAEAWIWLIENAAYENTKHRVGNTIEKVDRGSMFCTLRGLAKAWKWRSDHRVRKFLEILESEKMILKCNRTKKTQLTICNYSTYQDDGRNGGATGAH
ncbi:MAG: hypothetical protein GY749_22865 [Desulfobacteraceae bacterium]|nr:hypothetical protein [Desulfobacteraceae bacterium]